MLNKLVFNPSRDVLVFTVTQINNWSQNIDNTAMYLVLVFDVDFFQYKLEVVMASWQRSTWGKLRDKNLLDR